MASVIELTFQIVEQAVGMLTFNSPSIRATAREDSDRKLAAMWSDLFQWMWQKSKGDLHFRDIVRDHYVQGRGVACVYPDWNADFGKGEVKFKSLEPKNVFPDPRAKDPQWDDAKYIITRNLYTLHQIGLLWGSKAAAKVKAKASPESGSVPFARQRNNIDGVPLHEHEIDVLHDTGEQYEIMEHYEKVKRTFWRVFNPQTGVEEIMSAPDYAERREMPAYVVQQNGVERVVTNMEEVAGLDDLYNQYGEIFHQVPSRSSVDDSGMLIQGPPMFIPGPAGENAIPGSEMMLTPTTMGALIDMGRIPVYDFLKDRVMVTVSAGEQVLLFEPYELPISHYPIIPFPNASNRNPYPKSDVSRLRPIQEKINKTESLLLAHLANTTNQKVFYPEGQFGDVAHLEQEWAKAGTAFIKYDPVAGMEAGGSNGMGGIVIASPSPLSSDPYRVIHDAIAQMERIAGLYALQQGEPGQAPHTFRGTLAIDEFAQRRMKHKLNLIYDSLTRMGEVMGELAQSVYTSEKVIRVTSPSGEEREHRLNVFSYNDYTAEAETINDITKGHYDFIVVQGSTLPSNRWAREQQYLELYREGIVDDIAVLRSSEVPDAEAIIERNSLVKRQQQALQQLQEQMQDVMGDLQTAQREAVSAEKRAEVQKFKAALARIMADVDKAATESKKDLQRAAKMAERASEEKLRQQRDRQRQPEAA